MKNTIKMQIPPRDPKLDQLIFDAMDPARKAIEAAHKATVDLLRKAFLDASINIKDLTPERVQKRRYLHSDSENTGTSTAWQDLYFIDGKKFCLISYKLEMKEGSFDVDVDLTPLKIR